MDRCVGPANDSIGQDAPIMMTMSHVGGHPCATSFIRTSRCEGEAGCECSWEKRSGISLIQHSESGPADAEKPDVSPTRYSCGYPPCGNAAQLLSVGV
jgi:hypothetical protein